MTRVAYLTASCVVSDDAREDAFEHDLSFDPLRSACAARGIDLEAVVWDDVALRIDDYDALVLGTTWDYQEKPEQFLAFLDTAASRRPVWNPPEVVRWNLQKTYLRDLQQRGIRIVPTRYVDGVDEAAVEAALDAFETDRVVVKPVIGATAWRQVLLDRGAPLPDADDLPLGAGMIQPFLHSIVEEGEYGFLFFDGEYSHCAQKLPQRGDYRVQSLYGGREKTHEASAAEIALCQQILAAVEARLLYARIDLVRDADGELAVMELELIEPFYYPLQGTNVGETWTRALERVLG